MKVKLINIGGINFIEPIDNVVLFAHCSNGDSKVTEKYFDSHVTDLLLIHGIMTIETISEDVE